MNNLFLENLKKKQPDFKKILEEIGVGNFYKNLKKIISQVLVNLQWI